LNKIADPKVYCNLKSAIGVWNRRDLSSKHTHQKLRYLVAWYTIYDIVYTIQGQTPVADPDLQPRKGPAGLWMLNSAKIIPALQRKCAIHASCLKCVKWGWLAYTTSTVRDICRFAVLCSVTRPFLSLHSCSWTHFRVVCVSFSRCLFERSVFC